MTATQFRETLHVYGEMGQEGDRKRQKERKIKAKY